MDGSIKIGDLGLGVELPAGSLAEPLPPVGSLFWMAPEVCGCRPYGYKADVFSFGCVVMELVTGQPNWFQFRGLKSMFLTATQGAQALSDPLLQKVSTPLKDFLRRALSYNALTRASVVELLAHPFLQKVAKKQEMERLVTSYCTKVSLYSSGLL